MNEEEYRRNFIHYEVTNAPGSRFWNATGYVVFFEGRKLRSLPISGTPDRFTTEEAAKDEFLDIAKILINRRLRK
jgi:hypothetical protein